VRVCVDEKREEKAEKQPGERAMSISEQFGWEKRQHSPAEAFRY
jgi:hypothetical protein